MAPRSCHCRRWAVAGPKALTGLAKPRSSQGFLKHRSLLDWSSPPLAPRHKFAPHRFVHFARILVDFEPLLTFNPTQTNCLRQSLYKTEYTMRSGQLFLLTMTLACVDTGKGLEDVAVQLGELPLIISAPHGGTLRPAEIAKRSTGKNTGDAFTADLAWLLSAELEDATGLRPHMVVNNLHRSRLDANREIVEAAEGDPRAEEAWLEYHTAIEAAQDRVVEDHLSGLYIDLHGHSHDIQRVEVGYLLLDFELSLSNDELDEGTNCQVSLSDTTPIACAEKSSVHELTSRTGGRSLSVLLHGEMGLGSMLEIDGVPAVPSEETVSPLDGEDYYNGGYSTIRHGSRDGGTISGVQLEMPSDIRQSSADREDLAALISSALLVYIETMYSPPI